MKRNDVFKFTAPNGVKVTGIVAAILRDDKYQKWWLCYAQNRLFNYWCHSQRDYETGELESTYSYGGVVVDYCIIPELDKILEAYLSVYDIVEQDAQERYDSWEKNLEEELQEGLKKDSELEYPDIDFED